MTNEIRILNVPTGKANAVALNRASGLRPLDFFSVLCVSLWLMIPVAAANPWNGRVVLQGFWWNYWNNNYPNDWATYLADLAPRLRAMGIDAVWIPPTVKNQNATGSVGYAPFDHYDLGDKFQGGSTGTRFGTKDAYLRMVAVLHANGIDVVQDLVWNHLNGAGSENAGAGGLDPSAWGSTQFKNFRYVCYATPAGDGSAADYGARRGRFPKNWQNFHPNPNHNAEGPDGITASYFGPDICYLSGAEGLSSNCSYNPTQSADYMRSGIRDWSVWLKKQTGVDGFRLDAAKHFEPWATQDFLWNLAYNALFASGGGHMYAVGEFVGSASEMDSWVDAVNASNGGGFDLVGTFDFNLRGALKNMVGASGSFDLRSLPSAQQNRRSRTSPFINSHDTVRPMLSPTGNYIGWDAANELGGHIDPFDPRVQAAYAVAMAMDGSPVIFFEDLFDIGGTGRRWTHRPDTPAELPARDWLTNLIWCHQKLNFKDGAYLVRWQAPELLIIERSGHAIIGVNDNWDTWQAATIQTAFGANAQLHDYSGSTTNEIRTDASGRATISVPPCNGSNVRRGYTVWGPVGIAGGFNPPNRGTTQEWEMADDLGDSHPISLGQGGALPANSTALRVVGRIFPANGKTVTINTYPQFPTNRYEVLVLAQTGAPITNAMGAGNLTLSYVPPASEYETIKVHYTEPTNLSQKVWVKATYTAPTSLRPVAPSFANLNWSASGRFQFTLTGGVGLSYILQATADLSEWNAITTNAAPFDFTNSASDNPSARFYRGLYLP
jgi:alpha-amylase